jgi:hypothetical protein
MKVALAVVEAGKEIARVIKFQEFKLVRVIGKSLDLAEVATAPMYGTQDAVECCINGIGSTGGRLNSSR